MDSYFGPGDTYVLPVYLNYLLMGAETAAGFCALQDKGVNLRYTRLHKQMINKHSGTNKHPNKLGARCPHTVKLPSFKTNMTVKTVRRDSALFDFSLF